MSHTPGPWKTYGGMVYAPGERGANVCEVSEPRATTTIQHTRLTLGSVDVDEAYANARLIAAAPELLEALKGWLPIAERQLESLHEEGRASAAYQFARERIEKSRVAIDKAEGRTS